MNLETWAYIHHLFFADKLPKKLIARKLGLGVCRTFSSEYDIVAHLEMRSEAG